MLGSTACGFAVVVPVRLCSHRTGVQASPDLVRGLTMYTLSSKTWTDTYRTSPCSDTWHTGFHHISSIWFTVSFQLFLVFPSSSSFFISHFLFCHLLSFFLLLSFFSSVPLGFPLSLRFSCHRLHRAMETLCISYRLKHYNMLQDAVDSLFCIS